MAKIKTFFFFEGVKFSGKILIAGTCCYPTMKNKWGIALYWFATISSVSKGGLRQFCEQGDSWTFIGAWIIFHYHYSGIRISSFSWCYFKYTPCIMSFPAYQNQSPSTRMSSNIHIESNFTAVLLQTINMKVISPHYPVPLPFYSSE